MHEISAPDPSAFRPSPTTSELVGRARDLRVLRAALRKTPSLTIVEGEAGVGKSRLVRELADDPELSGRVILIGQCEQLHEPFLLGPVLDALRQAAPTIRPERLGPVTGALSPLIPEIAHLLPPPPAAVLEPAAARHQVFRAVAALLEQLGPVVLVLEDAHWADHGTFDLLSFLAFHQPADVAVVLTTRFGAGPLPVAETFARAPAGPATVVRIEPLDSAEVREFARRMLGVDLTARAAGELRKKTGGIPLVLEEVLRTLRERLPDSPELLDSLAVPTALRDVILQRLSSLEPVAREIVGVASVLGRRVEPELLAAVAERPTREVVAAIASAQGVGLLQDENDTPHFRHALAQQAVYESLPAAGRRWLHARAVAAIEALPGAVRSARLAYHSKRAGDTVQFVGFAEDAADLAVASGDDAAAAQVLLEVVESGEVPFETRLRLAAKLGRVAVDGLAHADAVPLLTRLLDGGSLEPALRGELRLALGRMLRQQGAAAAGFEQVRLALPDLKDVPSLAARALAVMAVPENAVATHVREHAAWATQAERAAGASGDPAIVLAAQVAQATLLIDQGSTAAWSLIDSVRADSTLDAYPREVARACLNWAQSALHIGQVKRADELLAEARQALVRADYARITGVTELAALAADFAAGRWEGLAERVDAHADHPAEFGGAELDARLLQAEVRAATGSAAEAARALRALVRDAEQLGAVWPTLAARTTLSRLLLDLGEPDAAREHAEEALDLARAKGLWTWAGEPVLCVVEATCASADRRGLTALVDELSVGLGAADAPLARAALLGARAILADRTSDRGDAGRLFAEAVSILQDAGARLPEGRAAERLGAFRLSQGDAQGAGALEAALDVFGGLGARRDFSRVARTMREHGVALPSRWRPGRRPLGIELSEREREVAELAAAGLTNKEIASELFLSMRTVETHMSRALRKLGVLSRRELSDALREAARLDRPSGARGSATHSPESATA